VGFSGADIKNLVNEAALLAGRKNKKHVEMEDFEEARDKIQLGSVREEKIEENDKKIIAYHESGHTLVARLLPGTDTLQKVTIIPRGRALGATEQVPDTERHNLSRSYLLNRITVLLGGRAAEKLVFGDLTSGASNDLKTATHLAREMVCQWGMSEKLGPVSFPVGENHPFLGREMAQERNFSEYTAKRIDEEIQNIIEAAENRASDLLEQERKRLDTLAEALLERELLEAGEIESLLDFKQEDDE
jgi:cell division protease FtsH